MSVVLTKMSAPSWVKEFDSLHDAVTELRRYICRDCLDGNLWEDDEPLDTVVDGTVYPCMELGPLLATACGCEFDLDLEGADWRRPREEELEPGSWRRISRRKTSMAEIVRYTD